DACLAFEDLLERPCPILWDAHHTFHKAGEAIAETWERIRPFVRHVHFKDSVAEPNEINDYTLALPGEGRFPLAELFHLLRRDGYRGAVCLEWERKWQPWSPPLSAALEGLARTLAASA
ncbi:MAG: sugar phosphate isomerase/epimerase family protein, partial [Opitutales bacterium]